jgi:hypothetical protein
LLEGVQEIKDVTVHVDPEDDEAFSLKSDLPSRKDLLEKLQQKWQNYPAFERIQEVRLHYLSGLIHVEIYFPYGCVSEEILDDFVDCYRESKTVCADIAEVTVFFIVI